MTEVCINDTSLHTLVLSLNPLRRVNVMKGGLRELLIGIRRSYVDDTKVEHVDGDGVEDLTYLDLSGTSLTKIPFVNAHTLCLNRCEFRADSGFLKAERVEAAGCGLRLVPLFMGSMFFRSLCLEDNELVDISLLSGCTGLKDLKLARNKIQDIRMVSRVVGKLVELETLDLRFFLIFI